MAISNDPVRVASGLLAGTLDLDGTVRVFKGVPYARPPTGALRWRAPQAAERWDGVRPADHFGPRSVQPERPATAIGYFGPEAESEDCLYLNIWTAAPAPDARTPVMVWFHGGAYAVGSGALPIFDGARLARHGVVVVTVNYRLGRLGFLAHPELSREAPYRASGNYGLLDQLAALQWVQHNIAAFGGDPGRVTIFGQSVGATSVHCHMSSPLATGAFHRAIGQSGGSLEGSMATLETAERAGAALVRALGAGSIEELRARPAREVQLGRPGGGLNAVYDSSDAGALSRDTAWANIDGHVLPASPYDIFAQGRQNDVPLITGATADEGATLPGVATLAAHRAHAEAEFGAAAASFLKLYPAATDAEAEAASRRATGERNFTWQTWLWATTQARTGRAPCYHYHFSRVPPRPLAPGGGDASRPLGAFHTAEIPYVFDHLEVRDWPWQAADRTLADAMSAYWVNFAATGDPNGGNPRWPRFDADGARIMHFGDQIGAGAHPAAERVRFWNDIDGRSRR